MAGIWLYGSQWPDKHKDPVSKPKARRGTPEFHKAWFVGSLFLFCLLGPYLRQLVSTPYGHPLDLKADIEYLQLGS